MNGEKGKYICEKLIDMMETVPFLDISVTSFVKYAGISRSSFYLYFNSVYDVLDKIENDYIDGLLSESTVVQSTKHNRPNRIDGSIITKTEYIRNNKKLLRILTSENGDPSFSAKLAGRHRRMIRNRLKDCSQYSESEKRVLAEYMAAGQAQAFKWWVNHEEEIDIYDVLLFMEQMTLLLIRKGK